MPSSQEMDGPHSAPGVRMGAKSDKKTHKTKTFGNNSKLHILQFQSAKQEKQLAVNRPVPAATLVRYQTARYETRHRTMPTNSAFNPLKPTCHQMVTFQMFSAIKA